MIRTMSHKQAGELLKRKAVRLDAAVRVVEPILQDVRDRGDEALLHYARKFDEFSADSFLVPRVRCDDAWAQLPAEFRQAVSVARENIDGYARQQLPRETMWDSGDGRRLGQLVRPIHSMGAYIPAGRYPLPSTLLMCVLPAQAAGVRNIHACSPRPSPEILGIASLLNVTSVFQIGGAHAIAAFAYGTETVPRVERIVGPGNIYVAAAKKLLAGETGIDFIAGPTEVLIIAREGNARWIAADMLAQAEHDVDASAILLTTSRTLAREVTGEIERQLETLPTAAVAREAIERNSAIVIVDALDQAVEFSNRLAPEHLALYEKELLDQIDNAGSVFLGPASPEAAGDYASGPNHVLPTSGVARLRGGLSAADFVKVISVQELTLDGLRKLSPTITTLARAEGLEAHARSVEVRHA